MPSQACGSNIQQEKKKARAKKYSTTVKQTEQSIFEWTMKHQDAFDVLKRSSQYCSSTRLS